MQKTIRLSALAAGIATIFAANVQAAEFDSAFTEYDLRECWALKKDAFDKEYSCPGYENIPLYIATRDQKAFSSSGFNASRELAAQQTLPEANHLEPKVEWRLANISGKWRPFATIQRWHTKTEQGIIGETLVITKIGRGKTCHIAYLDAVTTPLVYHRARFVADLCARRFQCEINEPILISTEREESDKQTCAFGFLPLMSR